MGKTTFVDPVPLLKRIAAPTPASFGASRMPRIPPANSVTSSPLRLVAWLHYLISASPQEQLKPSSRCGLSDGNSVADKAYPRNVIINFQ
jgi:hypothetical protein